ncbi:hypothetical protein Kisp01_10080 [Kineosporia sp. NBRC 101677]|uniref:replication initiator n=1 Tax=Kineosporia sp. NBRC 101677 TaxID=3032197 RepID=UPI0024A011BA|nr:replication initiator [Kineosporia sp. NBRC 101677]GLY13992.1 hypothetical protein Kisp01_10080 [Kineosporia sp. NBRC 101677]
MTVLDDATPAEVPAESLADAPRPGSRLQRARMPLAKDVVEAVAVSHGVCIRPVPMKVTDEHTGHVRHVDVPCGATLASKCPSCAERARRLRVHQCREGWHLVTEPDLTPDTPNTEQRELATARADITAARDEMKAADNQGAVLACTKAAQSVDTDLRKAGVRGDIDPPKKPRRVRSTRRRQDAPDLPKNEMTDTTLGRAFTGHDGTVFRPSMFATVTLPSYGHVRADGTPVDPSTYDYRAAARDAIAFSRLIDRLVQNLRRVAGYDVQYFAAVEPQRRLAAHAHFAIRGTIPRALFRRVVAATYHQVWWPKVGEPVFDEFNAPVWQYIPDAEIGDKYAGIFVDPTTGEQLTGWDEALDAIDADPDAEPFHVARLGAQVDVQGLLSGTPEADRRVGYLAKYLTKSMTEAHEPEDGAQSAHLDRLVQALAVEPCSPTCANWLRYGIAPKNAHEGQRPGSCRSKAHRREHLGYAGRRILVSRKWSGKTLADHKHDRRAWVMATLGVNDPTTGSGQSAGRSDPSQDMTRDRFSWRVADKRDPIAPLSHRLLLAVAERQKWRAALDAAKNGQPPPADTNLSATGNDREETAA